MNPTGLRSSLYIRDDDYRLSFLFGDFITLTNLNERDWARIAEQHLSPLYVSVHATDTAVRRKMLANPRARPILEDIDRLAASGIQVHCQVVLCPGINDGAILERTITDLLDRYPQVLTLGIVPVGLTRFDTKYRLAGMAQLTKAQAQAVIDQVTPLQHTYHSRCGESLLFLSDEMYLLAQRPIPSAQSYNGYPQYENGIGMIRSWQNSFTRWICNVQQKRRQGITLPIPTLTSATVVTGHLFAPILSETVAAINTLLDTKLQVVAITNDFLGESVTVAGLLAGQDIITQLRKKHLGNALLIPGRALDQTETYFLDGTSRHDVEHSLGIPVLPGREWRDFLQLLLQGRK
jgi:putative radical SAM enzyme (TIGR03279 family)